MFKSAEISYLYKHSKKKNTTCNKRQLYEKSMEYAYFQSLQR